MEIRLPITDGLKYDGIKKKYLQIIVTSSSSNLSVYRLIRVQVTSI